MGNATRLLAPALLALILLAGLDRPARAVEAQDCTVTVGPTQDLNAAVRAAPNGATVCLRPGTYAGPLTVEFKGGLTFKTATPRAVPVIDGGGVRDALLVFNSGGITFDGIEIRNGRPANVYAFNAAGLSLRRVWVHGGNVGVHLDRGTSAVIDRSQVTKVAGDGVLIRRDSSVAITYTRIADNGGVGVSAVGYNRDVTVQDTDVIANRGPGVFAGQTPCALLPPATLAPPPCFRLDLARYVGGANVLVKRSRVLDSGSTGLVFFPGTYGRVSESQVLGNFLTGLFAWGAKVNVVSSQFDDNEEHAAEYRAYPTPEDFGRLAAPFPMRATGQFVNNVVKQSVIYPNAGLGGGLLSQGGDMKVLDNRFFRNDGIGISFVNLATGEIKRNYIWQNGGTAICLYKAGAVVIEGNTVAGNLSNKPGTCGENR